MPMANQTPKVFIGGIGLNLTAVPDSITFGLKEGMNVHQLVGGARVVDMTGDEPDEFVFSGTWLGADATDKANDMYSMQQKKELVQLQFGSISRDGVIAHTKYVYKRGYWIDFTITFLVVENVDLIGITTIANPFGFDANAALAADKQINNANGAPNLTPNDAGNNLLNGTNGLNQLLGAAGVNIGNPIAFG